jgi:hypothetical protein
MIPDEIKKEAKYIRKLLSKLEKDPKFIEDCEQFQREISYLSPKERLRVFDI